MFVCVWDCEQGFGSETFYLADPDPMKMDPPENAKSLKVKAEKY